MTNIKMAALVTLCTVAFTATAHAEPFSGPYVGAEITHDSFELDSDAILSASGTTAALDSLNGNGVGLGIFAGYDYLINDQFFIGGEAKLHFSDAKMSITLDDGVDVGRSNLQAKESYGISARGGAKINDSTGIYARLGWVNTKFKQTSSLNGTRTFDDRNTNDGFLYGAGLETFIGDNAGIRVEYTVTDYGHFEDGAAGVMNNQISAGFSWHF